MNAGLIILRVASLGRDAQNERDGARAAQLRRSSDSVAASLQRIPIALNWNWSSHRRVPRQQHLEEGRELRAAAAPSPQHQLRRSSISRRRQCPATMSGRRGLFFWNCSKTMTT